MPQVQSKNPVIGQFVLDTLVEVFSAVPGAAALVTPFVHLFTAGPPGITRSSAVADFTEATFAGYVAKALTLPLLGTITVNSQVVGAHNDVDFLAGSVVPPGEMIAGYWIDEAVSGGSDFYMGEFFENPIPIGAAGDYISLDVVFAVLWEFAFG